MTTGSEYHAPVLLHDCVDALRIREGGIYVDVTFGGGGHSRAILEKLDPSGSLVAFDRDRDAWKNAPKDPRFTLRTVESIEDKTGAEIGYFITWLRDRGIGYVTKRQRHTDEPLIGLAARN